MGSTFGFWSDDTRAVADGSCLPFTASNVLDWIVDAHHPSSSLVIRVQVPESSWQDSAKWCQRAALAGTIKKKDKVGCHTTQPGERCAREAGDAAWILINVFLRNTEACVKDAVLWYPPVFIVY